MNTYKIILDEDHLDKFINFLPDLLPHEVYYFTLMARHKYNKNLPKGDNPIHRFIVWHKEDIKEKIRRLEAPGNMPQDALALYGTFNPRSILKANKNLLVELAKRIADGNNNFDPVSLAHTEIHKATDRKVFVDFDYDNKTPEDHLSKIKEILPNDSFTMIRTHGGFHLLVTLDKVNKTLWKPIVEGYSVKGNWFTILAGLEGCDVTGSNNLVPVPGCTQGGYIPFLTDY